MEPSNLAVDYVKMPFVDRVLFRMPQDRELQVCAVNVVQGFVMQYVEKIASKMPLNVSPDFAYTLQYALEGMDDDAWDVFIRAGLLLDKQPVSVLDGPPGMVADMRDARLYAMRAQTPSVHASQVCNKIVGLATQPFPQLRQVEPIGKQWGVLSTVTESCVGAVADCAYDISLDDILRGGLYGVVGVASLETYLAAAVGLHVVEILPEGRPRTWLSKFSSKRYRMVDVDKEHWPEYIATACANLEQMPVVRK